VVARKKRKNVNEQPEIRHPKCKICLITGDSVGKEVIPPRLKY
jgi:hypothetical protein